jgi:glycosyltransferase involved in cell wall biosynthesis
VINLLFFGTIRPYKGLEELLKVFNGLTEREAAALWLTVVGETWENCTEPARMVAASPHRDRITFVNDYVPDEVVSAAFAHADVVVLPYRRSSSSGPLHVAMSWGLPVVVTRVGGLPEAAAGYDGAIFAPPGDGPALKAAIGQGVKLVGQRFPDPRTWAESASALLTAAGLSP